ncbi:ABCD2 / ATP-binding cassette protein subfamily D [Leishmania donovani]|uniref:Glycosomal_transporter_(GAT1)_-_putative n=3 Tax=Leishmania donovani species complex TaxID=38574 RepID=A0A6L0XQK6_LEIIN|nr:ATP-binding cassette protein subfamily D, member 2 [Leishmania infantum JPCM5]CAC9517809.1 glycosomal_transporter_(GAT1)_-_putative [Leishmania infantum]CAJ1991238.1 ABCD2 / ATP-binding cassette protein subfamily D [Leishmania donovani]CAM70437.1 ATP-binding cassette protein subfamily D, member 2 [Leishmania infantum JPCM5]SUZ44259.1 glycosomal_transporter_(GAT1)_-_putative [Leishmania infantum]VDZ47084.1 glycosomal_transporter_(GAT1)_putative/GeneDB:LmjF.31.0540 [Leishmania donovani]|eukprot:XP_001467380.1 ATP-binding cassette protein subfamily D, member 2 [Leishmania infantum JPCM5]
MVSSEVLGEYVREYAASRLRDPVMASWVGGSLAFLATMYATSSGRQLAKAMPPPPLRGIQGSIVRGTAASEVRKGGGLTLVPQSTPLSPSSPVSRATTSSVFISASAATAEAYSQVFNQEVSVFNRFMQLLRVAIPNCHGREARSIYILFVLMIVRAYVSVRLVNVSGLVSRTAIEGNLRHAIRALALFAVSCVPATLLNVTLDYYSELLGLHCRDNLAAYFSDRYLKRRVFFQMAGLHEVDHVDQRITEDVRNWARVSASLFTSIPRPLIEAITFSFTLARQTGWRGTLLTWSYYLTFAVWICCCAPNLDWMVQQRTEKEGAVRRAHQRLLAYAEEITLTKGFQFHEKVLQRLFKAVTDQSRYAAYVRSRFDFTETLHNKYGSVLLGYVVCAMATMHQKNQTTTAETATAALTCASYTFKTLATAIGKSLWNVKLVFVVGGYTRRLAQLLAALDRADVLVEMQTSCTAQSPIVSRASGAFPVRGNDGKAMSNYEDSFGRIVRSDHIEFVDVPLVLPTGECLCSSMSFYVKPGMNLLILGRNGCGKSSTFRLLGELWPLRGGRIEKPEAEQLYYVPQRPYMYDGTLLEQVIYPLKKKDLTVGEAELYGYLQMAGLDYVFSKLNMSWETRLPWSDDSLSLGEQQRLAMARLFFHRPRFAILDECSSLVDLDVERQMYDRCVELGITVITIAHRRSVWQYHNWILYFDGSGGYMFSPLQYETGASALVLTCVRSASDASLIGTEVRIPITDRLCSEDETVTAKKEPPPKLIQTAQKAEVPKSPRAETVTEKVEREERAKANGDGDGVHGSHRQSRHRRSRKHRASDGNKAVGFETQAETSGGE